MRIAPPVDLPAESPLAARLVQPGWLLLPLRGFLAVTFCFAGLQKVANPSYLDPSSPASVVSQLRLLRHSSPIGPLLGVSLHAPTVVGLAIAFGELAVGVGALIGLFTRVAALGGALLSLTFFLTVSWTTTPYYYGSDIVFVFCWLTLFAFGDGGVLSLQARLRPRARTAVGHHAGAGRILAGHQQAELDRRTALVAAAVVAALTATTAGLTAAIGRAVRPSNRRQLAGLPLRAGHPQSTKSAAGASTGTSTESAAAGEVGTAIGSVAQVPVGQAARFTDPTDGRPAWLVHESGPRFVAFSAICTHAGCTVGFDASTTQFVCPCHGGVYDASTGQVVSGPPPAPLPPIPVRVVAGQIRVDA